MRSMKSHLLPGLLALALAVPALADREPAHVHQGMGHGAADSTAAHHEAASATITVKGEVVDLVCYIDHNAQGAKHADCARTCIESGLPVGIKAEDGTLYLLVGEHKPLNKTLAAYAAKTITVRGKAASRDGVNMLENAEILEP